MRLPRIRNGSLVIKRGIDRDGGEGADHPLCPCLDHPTTVGGGDKAYEGGDAFYTSRQMGFLYLDAIIPNLPVPPRGIRLTC